MSKPNQEQINEAIKWLQENKQRIPRRNAFGEDLHDKIDAEIAVMSEDLSEDDIYNRSRGEDDEDEGQEWDHHQRDSALCVRQWMDGEEESGPIENWTPLVGRGFTLLPPPSPMIPKTAPTPTKKAKKKR